MSLSYNIFPLSANTADSLDFGICGPVLQSGFGFQTQSVRSRGVVLLPTHAGGHVRVAAGAGVERREGIGELGRSKKRRRKRADVAGASRKEGLVSCVRAQEFSRNDSVCHAFPSCKRENDHRCVSCPAGSDSCVIPNGSLFFWILLKERHSLGVISGFEWPFEKVVDYRVVLCAEYILIAEVALEGLVICIGERSLACLSSQAAPAGPGREGEAA